MRVQTRDPDAPGRWDFYKRVPPHSPVRPKIEDPGKGAGCKRGRETCRPFTMVCRRAGCGALVGYRAAKEAAYKAGRHKVAAGAGCSNPRHDARRGAARERERRARGVELFMERQEKMRRQLERGERILVEWPTSPWDANIWRRPKAAVEAAVKKTTDGEATHNGWDVEQ